MSEQLDREDHAIEVALSRCLERGDVIDPFDPLDAADEALVREYTELLGLLPCELEPVVPNLSTKVRLLAVVGGDAGASGTMSARSERTPGPTAVPTPQRSVDELTFQTPSVDASHERAVTAAAAASDRSPVDVTLRHQGIEGGPDDGADLPSTAVETEPAPSNVRQLHDMTPPAHVVAAPSSPSWATWAMAAMLGFCMLGMGYLVGQSREQQATIAQLQTQVAQPAVADPGLSELLQDLELSQRRLRMVTQVARSAYPLRTVSNVADARQRPDGIMYVCGQHQRWYLNVKGLEPPMPGKEYRLWFITPDGTVDGGTIDVEPGALVQKEANSMPMGTQGFSITLEDIGEQAGPEGLMVLLGEQAVSL